MVTAKLPAGIREDITQCIGRTPLVRLRRVTEGCVATIAAKIENMNPLWSVKDRIACAMVDAAERDGLIGPDTVIIEPTSGNTGIGMALAAAVRGYRMVITMPEKMSREKQVVLEALGAEIIRTPTEAAFDAPESHIGVAKQLQKILPNAHILNQYGNPDNPMAHYEGTGREIVEQCDGKLDILVLTAGTGGTLSGIARRVKEEVPNCRIVGVDPVGSLLAGPSPIGSYKVEGIGYDFIPDVLDRDLVDEWVKTEDRESFLMARRLIRKEGMLVGGSAGSAVWAAVQMGKKYGPGKRIVTLAPDSVRNYMTKFLDDGWMRANGFADRSWEAASVAELLRTLPRRELVTAEHGHTVSEAVKLMKSQGISQLPVVEDGRLVGILTESDVLGKLVDGRATLASKVAEVMFRNVRTVEESDDVGLLSKIFNEGLVAVVVGEDRALKGIVTKLDLVDFLTRSTG